MLFYGAVNPRRARVLEHMAKSGLKTKVVFGVYGAARDALIARSRIVLNVHYYEARVFEVVRVSYLLANRRFVLSETGDDAALESDFRDGVGWASYEDLPEACARWLAMPEDRVRVAATGLDIMRARPQPELLRPALSALPFPRD